MGDDLSSEDVMAQLQAQLQLQALYLAQHALLAALDTSNAAVAALVCELSMKRYNDGVWQLLQAAAMVHVATCL
jgi:hypothetical protein